MGRGVTSNRAVREGFTEVTSEPCCVEDNKDSCNFPSAFLEPTFNMTGDCETVKEKRKLRKATIGVLLLFAHLKAVRRIPLIS